jgi:uncharacterized membrane protein SpoIIM required for sporulation/uncharacterized RDD family membrane protein YckC
MPSSSLSRTRAPQSLEQLVDVETPEQVVFSYTIAGVGSRAAAAIVDYLVCAGAFAALLLLGYLATRPFAGVVTRDVTAPWVVALLALGQFAILWGYYVLFEGLRDGQTPGKRRLGLRVVQDGGYSVTFAASAVRNIVRVVDMQPAVLYGVGIVSAALSSQGKRIGDLAAGTIVVREQLLHAPPAAEQTPAGAEPSPVPVLADEEFALLERFMERRQSLEAARRAELAEQLAHRFGARVPELAAGGTAAMLPALFARERRARARGAATRSDTGARREQHAIVVQGAARWSTFAALLGAAQRRGLAAMSEEEVSAFVARYREVTTDLARLRTAARGRELDAVFYLSRLVAGGHNLLYRRRQAGGAALWRFMTAAVPRELRRSWRPIALAAVLLFGPAVVSFETVRRYPEVAPQLLPASLIDRAETGGERARRGAGGYLPEEIARLRGPVLASAIMANNVQVTYVAFALGVTAGVGTTFALVFNGVAALGAPLGLYASKGLADQILGFVAPHGVLELAAICIAGGAGLLLAAAILLPGARTRREALVTQGGRAVHLVAASTFLLVIAALLEGNVSPLPWPNEWKYAVAGATAVFLVGYVGMGRRHT